MPWMLVLPAAVAVAAGAAAGHVRHRVRPSWTTVGLTVLAGVAAAGALSALVMVSVVFVGQLPGVADRLAWCFVVVTDHSVPASAGAAALVGVAAMVSAAAGTVRRLRHTERYDGDGLVVLPTDVPTAFAVPGRPGQIVVSRGMLRSLAQDERRVLLAHERSHLRRRHHRYLWVAEVAASSLPLLRPLRDSIRLATERWADEEAAAEVGDRGLVARAISRAALAQHDHQSLPAMAMAGPGVGRRVEALLDTPSQPAWAAGAAVVAAASTMGAGLVGSGLQLHHVLVVAAHLCRAG